MIDISEIVNFNEAFVIDRNNFEKIKLDLSKSANKYGINFSDDLITSFTDICLISFEGMEDMKKYRKSLQIFDLCKLKGKVTIQSARNKINIDEVILFEMLNPIFDFKAQIMQHPIFASLSEEQTYKTLIKYSKNEEREQRLKTREIIKRLFLWLRGNDLFVNVSNTTKIKDREAAFIYDLLFYFNANITGTSPEQATNRQKRDNIKSYLR